MHGRILLATTGLLLALCAPAGAAVTVGPDLDAAGPPQALNAGFCTAVGCTPPVWAVVAPDAVAPFDGVVVRWRIRSGAAGTGRLRTVQPAATSWIATARGEEVAFAAGVTEHAARAPIGKGGRLALEAARLPEAFGPRDGGSSELADGRWEPGTGQPRGGGHPQQLLVQADVEPDADGDAHGDETQDACPADFSRQAAPCLRTTLGSPLHLAPAGTAPGGGAPYLQSAAPGVPLAVQGDGVLTRVRLRSTAESATVHVLAPAGEGFTVVESVDVVPGPGVTTVDVAIPVRAGDRLAVRGGATAAVAGDEVRTPQAAGSLSGHRLLLQGDVEPDGDGDGRGDVSRADLQVTGAAPAESGATQHFEHRYTVRNAGPDPAVGVVVSGTGLVGGPCTGEPACRLGTLAPGASVELRGTWAEPAVFPPLPGPIATAAAVTSRTVDPDAGNDGASLTTVRRPYAGPPPPPPAAPCKNRITGTRDDELLRGTGFGDLIRGGLGSDRVLGGAGDDCLEGGGGPDVLDGQDGDDRLSGGTHRDYLLGGGGRDRLVGGVDADRLSGGAGDDELLPGRGRDRVSGGPGKDTVSARDGARDVVDCGPGRDTARVDRVDRVKGCEKVTRR